MSTGILNVTLRSLIRSLPKLHCSSSFTMSTSCPRAVLSTTNKPASLTGSAFCSSERKYLPCSGHGINLSRSLSSKSGKQTVKIQFIDRDGDSFIVDAEIGENLMKVAHQHDIDLEGACEGTLSCCTCHLVVHPDWYDKLGSEPCEDELDMLDMAYGLTDTSRLGCQVVVRPDFEGLVVRIPPYEPQYT